MDAREIIDYIANSEKKTPVKLYVKERESIDYGDAKVFGSGDKVIFGDWKKLEPIIAANQDKIEDIVIENSACNTGVPMLDLKGINALWLRRAGVEQVDICDHCTACHPELYWSHRKMGGARGSQIAMISL